MDLLPMSDAHFAWLLGEQVAPPGAPSEPEGEIAPAEVHALIRGIAANLHAQTGSDVAWLMVVDGEAVGIISFTKFVEGLPEIGYGVAPLCRGRGHAAAAVKALLPIARSAGYAGLFAETGVDNPASQRALERNAFMQIGERDDPEDGKLLRWVVRWGEV